MLTRSKRYLADAARAFERAPVEVITGVLLAIAFSHAVESGDTAFRTWIEVAVAGLLIISVAWTGTLLHALGAWTAQQRWIVTAAGAAVVAVYASLVLDFERAAEGWRAAMLVAAAVLWLAYVPALATARGGSGTDRIRSITGSILLRTIGAALYGAALYAGLALALGAVNTLFELGLRGAIYAHVFGWIFLVLAPWVVIGGLPDYVGPQQTGPVAGVVHRMTAYLVPPLLALYCAILYAYAIRIGLTGEVPKNLLSPMVLAAGGLAALALYLYEPRPVTSESTASAGTPGGASVGTPGGASVGNPDAAAGGTLRWLRLAPPLFLPLAVLGLWAITLRVNQYGWTEFRLLRVAMLAALALLGIGATVQLVQRRRFSLHIALLSICVLLVIGAIGPWSVMAVSRRSQQAELDAALRVAQIDPAVPLAGHRAAGRPSGDTALARRVVPGDVYQRINDSARYLMQHFGSDALPPVLRQRIASGESIYDVAQTIGLHRAAPAIGEQSMFNAHFADGSAAVIRGIRAYRLTVSPERGRATSGAVTVEQDSTRLRLTVAGQSLNGDLRPFTAALRPAPDRGGMLTGDEARIPLTDSAGRAAGDMLVLHISLVVEDGVLRLRHLDGLLFIEARPDTAAAAPDTVSR